MFPDSVQQSIFGNLFLFGYFRQSAASANESRFNVRELLGFNREWHINLVERGRNYPQKLSDPTQGIKRPAFEL